ncbi:indole-3-glycerol-phosphate synthase [Ponticaulis sp.]|uniref:indole-3-glycerol phosphate synthase TrpC n=1 Tax=Ponticaulis sp. TaxID=2020902 RepID=UPI000C389947|nr:indole-3-glycerol phosphate synthase TrpC [Ponticaulis sp.]MBN04703.1 indole-3-glycerol phosphate synthase [Ponticaulis sp.]|tara:strand:- start:8 stop:808 length:801 start_codon:yes stop_codon:yes gene_type:complete
MTTALDRINAYKLDEVKALRAERTEDSFLRDIKTLPAPRGFLSSMNATVAAGRNALICEIKRKSPSAGDILMGADPAAVARDYENGGATCLSVLTDGPSFGGSLSDLKLVRDAVSMPILRKDFMLDPIQILEARAHEADCILIIMASFDNALASELLHTAKDVGLDALVEVHDEAELERAHAIGADFIGVNNRNLKEMTTDLGVSERLASDADANNLMVSESGVKTVADIKRLRQSGYRRFLIGESLMKETERELAVKNLVYTAEN